jgi:hypothetical protein
MGQILNRPLWTASYFQDGIPLEGVRQFILLNAKPFNTNADVIGDLESVLPSWKAPLYESSTPQQQESVRRKLSVVRLSVWHPRLTLWITNHSDSAISVKSVSLWHERKRLCSGSLSDNRKSVEIRPHSENNGIAFTTDEDTMLKLQSVGAVDRHLPSYSYTEDVDIEVHLEYEALGIESEYTESIRVRVYTSREIQSL